MFKKIYCLLLLFFICLQTLSAWEFIDKKGDVIHFDLVQEDDLKACQTVFVEAFSEAYRDFTPELLVVQDKLLFLQDAFADVYNDVCQNLQQLVVAKKDNQVIGFVGFKKTEKPHQIYISQLAVDPQYWQNGIGRELVFSALRLFADANQLVVIPRKINIVARGFYYKIGFVDSSYMHPGYSADRYVGYEWNKSDS